MNINLTLLAQAVSFAILIWFTVKFVWPPLLNAVETRQKQIADGLAAGERGRQADRRDDEIEEVGGDEDQHHHRGRTHRAFDRLAQHFHRQPSLPPRKPECGDHAERCRLGGRGNAGVDRADHDEEDAERRQQVDKSREALR